MIADLGTTQSRIRGKIIKKIQSVDALADCDYEIKVFNTPDPQGRAARMKQRNKHVLHLEKIVTDYLEKKLENAEREKRGESLHDLDPEPMMRPPGWLAWADSKVEALPWFRREIVKDWNDASKSKAKHKYAFVSFSCAGDVSRFLQACGGSSNHGSFSMTGWEIDFAPASVACSCKRRIMQASHYCAGTNKCLLSPKGIIWGNIGSNSQVRFGKNVGGYFLLSVLLVVYTPVRPSSYSKATPC